MTATTTTKNNAHANAHANARKVGGTLLAARLPLGHGLAASLGGGTHHAAVGERFVAATGATARRPAAAAPEGMCILSVHFGRAESAVRATVARRAAVPRPWVLIWSDGVALANIVKTGKLSAR